jgi:methylenetetrahydrofolate dehydrogenase (NADP+)/methenyltetrahydrofolate cyclohydrolase
MQIIDGKKLSGEILENIKGEISKLNFVPIFCDVLVGSDPSSAQYVRMKAKKAESVGKKFHNAHFPDSITTEELVNEIKVLNKIENMCGIIVQLPLPASLDRRVVLDAIDPSLDVDCLGAVEGAKFYEGKSFIGFPTALACMALLDSINVDLKGKNIVALGQGELVGKPVTQLLRSRGLDPVTITRQTENKEELIKAADIIISGIGHGKHINGDMVKKGVIIIDAGTSESNNAIVGDVDLESVKDVASYVSPVPGGVGPVTVAMLLNNVLKVAQRIK